MYGKKNSFSTPKVIHTNKVGIAQKEEKLHQDYIRVSPVQVLAHTEQSAGTTK